MSTPPRRRAGSTPDATPPGSTVPWWTIVALAAVLGLSSADVGAMGALAAPLERQFHIGNTSFGLLITVSTLVGAVIALPAGVLADHVDRVGLLRWAVVAWAVATVLESCSISYGMLLGARTILGLLVAAAGPFVVSLAGDAFPTERRARLFGYVLTGELVGAGIGILVAGTLSGIVGWRIALGVLALPALALAWGLSRHFDEPPRRHHGSSERGDVPAARDLLGAVRYVLRVRSNVILILASGLGYFFFQGLETFAELFLRDRFGVAQGAASALFVAIGACAVIGAVGGGRFADRLAQRGSRSARLVVAGCGFLLVPLLLAPGLATGTLLVSLPFFLLAGIGLGCVNPPLDAARLDVVPSQLWGRAEAVRTTARTLFQAAAPLAFGAVSTTFGGAGGGFGAGVNTAGTAASAASGRSLAAAFGVLSLPLLAAGGLLLAGRSRYVADRRSAQEPAFDPAPHAEEFVP